MKLLKTNNLIVTTILFCSLALITFAIPTRAHADICDPEKNIFDANATNFSLDLRRTVDNMITASISSFFSKVTGGSPERTIGCIKPLISQTTDPDVQAYLGTLVQNCDDTDPNFCTALNNTFAEPGTQVNRDTTLQELARTDSSYHHSAGSLMGFGNRLQNAANEPVPLTYAYFFNRQIEKVPYMGTAFAQSATYSGPYLDVVYDVWVIFRNAAFGIMAVIMVIVGILIMTRKKINPQTAVTVQYAVPRIVISLILIAFSYIIGATLASFAWALRWSGDNIIRTLGGFDPGGLGAALDLASAGTVMSLLLAFAISLATGIGTVVFVIGLLVVVVAIFMWIIVQIKLIFVYIKFLIEIITAPITFARAAIPGQESAIPDWFKKVTAYTLGLLGANVAMGVTQVVAAAMMISIAGSIGDPVHFATAAFITPYVVLFIFIYGYNYARNVPNKIETAIMGDKKKGGR